MKSEEPKRVAVIGSGAAGLAATHFLQRQVEITLFEKESQLGGHANTVKVPSGPDAGLPIDTGFIVMNHRNYPLLTRLFQELGVPLQNSSMTFGYFDQESGLQYCGSSLRGLFAQRRNLVRPGFYRLLRETLRFYKQAQRDLAADRLDHMTLGEYLARHQFGREFIEHHLLPMGAAIWSTPCLQMMDFPARGFIQFFQNHGLLTLRDRPTWKTVTGGSREYIRRMRREWRQVEVRLQARVEGVRRGDHGVELHFRDGVSEFFDHVVLATHADQALKLLADPSPEESRLLSPWRYSRNRTVLHTDARCMPPLKSIWSAWNFIRRDGQETMLTYHMNALQALPTRRQYFVTLNPPQSPAECLYEIEYEHPMYTREALASRTRLKQLNGQRNTWFAGSYFGNGFHEDAIRSGIEVANALGVQW